MSVITNITSGLTRALDFKGRATRSEFWVFALFYFGLMIVLGVIDPLLFPNITVGIGFGPLVLITALLLFVPALSVTVRRIHDTGRSPFWIYGFFGGIVAFALLMVATSSANVAAFPALIIGLAFLGLMVWAMAIVYFLTLPGT